MTTLAGPTAAQDVSTLVERRVPGFSLEGPFYTDKQIFDLDITAVFATSWLFVASEPELAEPGDFVTVPIGPYSIIVIRDDDEQVRAFHNVCRHRGTRILTETSGSVGNIVCGYHRWTYGTDGSLLHAGQQPADFDKSCYGLRSVHVRLLAGLVFISLAERPPADFDEVVDRVEPYVTPHRLGRTKVAAQYDLVQEANWKLVMENNRECYHCEGSHPELTCTFFPTYGYAEDEIPTRLQPAHDRYVQAEADLEQRCAERGVPFALIEELYNRSSAFRVQREALDGAGESYTLDGRAASHKLLGDFDISRLGRLSLHTQPNSWFHMLSDHVVTFALLPIATDQTLVRTTWLVHEDAEEGVDYDLDTLTYVWRKTNEQDGVLCARAQEGVTSPAYVPGPYAGTETHLEALCSWYIDRLEEHVG